MKAISVLGSTGSIGESTLDIVAQHSDAFELVAISANSNYQKLWQQIEQFKPAYAVIVETEHAAWLQQQIDNHSLNTELLTGTEGLVAIAQLEQVDMVMAAIVGAAGLLPTLAAVDAGKRVLLANKESLVMSGELFMQRVAKSGAELLPIDSEHNAIFQCMPVQLQQDPSLSMDKSGVSEILLTGSGGPFLSIPLEQLQTVTPAQACKHPNWSMGQKISVDSATMMNKGLEFIEAKWLFHTSPENIQVVIHPQSIIHSMVRYRDGSVLAQMGNPDMRTPIAHAMSYPNRINSGVAELDFKDIANFTFHQPDFERFPNLKLAIECCKSGQAQSTVLNAANEVSVAAFLTNRIKFTDIAKANETILQLEQSIKADNLEDILAIDQWARDNASQIVEKLARL